MIHTAEQTLIDLGYLRSDPEINFANLEQLVRVIRQQMVIECIHITRENAEADCHESTVLRFKELLDQIK